MDSYVQYVVTQLIMIRVNLIIYEFYVVKWSNKTIMQKAQEN